MPVGLTRHIATRGTRVATPGRAVRMALSLVNTSIPLMVNADELKAAIQGTTAPFQATARIMLEEGSQGLLADLVREGFVEWQDLAAAAERYPPANHETAAWIRDMARLALAGAAGARH